MKSHIRIMCVTFVIVSFTSCGAAGNIDGVHLDQIQLPAGFDISNKLFEKIISTNNRVSAYE